MKTSACAMAATPSQPTRLYSYANSGPTPVCPAIHSLTQTRSIKCLLRAREVARQSQMDLGKNSVLDTTC